MSFVHQDGLPFQYRRGRLRHEYDSAPFEVRRGDCEGKNFGENYFEKNFMVFNLVKTRQLPYCLWRQLFTWKPKVSFNDIVIILQYNVPCAENWPQNEILT